MSVKAQRAVKKAVRNSNANKVVPTDKRKKKSTHDIAIQLLREGFSVIPIRADGSKSPLLKEWKPYQSRRATEEQIAEWFGDNIYSYGIGIICGDVSSNLAVADFETSEVFEAFRDKLPSNLRTLIDSCPSVLTPGSPKRGGTSGVHVYMQIVDAAPPSDPKVARRLIDGKEQTLIEIKGKGGYVIAPGSPACCHPENKPYEWRGKPIYESNEAFPIRLDEYAELLNVMRSFNEIETPKKAQTNSPTSVKTVSQWSEQHPVIDDFNENADIRDILEPFDFTLANENGSRGSSYWCKPGSTSHQFSFGADGRPLLKCFGVHDGFEQDRSYSKFSAYCILNNVNRFKAIENLSQKGYGWEEPVPITSQILPVLPYPEKGIHPRLRPFITDESKKLGCSPDYVWAALYAIIGGVIGRRAGVCPKQHGDWFLTPNMCGLNVGGPSSKKSPATENIFSIIDDIEKELTEENGKRFAEHQKEVGEYKLQKQVYEQLRKEQIKKELQSNKSKPSTKTNRAQKTLTAPTPPVEPATQRIKVGDFTVEKLADICKDNPKGVIVHRDELNGMINSFSREGHQNDRAFLIEAMDGKTSTPVDRIGRGSLWPRSLVSIWGTTQPDLFATWLRSAQNDGFIQRISQLAVYPDLCEGEEKDCRPDREAFEIVETLLKSIETFQFTTNKKPMSEKDPAAERGYRFKKGTPYFKFDDKVPAGKSESALELFRDGKKAIEDQMREFDKTNPMLSQHYGKSAATLAKLAFIDHAVCMILDGVRGPIRRVSILRACRLMEALMSHAERLYGLNLHGSPLVEAIAKEIKSKRLKGSFTNPTLMRVLKQSLTKNPREVDHALSELERFGWLKRHDIPSGKRQKGTTKWLINPKILLGKDEVENEE